ncbi:MAG: hypothetical protein J1E57_11025 [Prevotella sp.]|nr:hypothetical protein [Prevotella sp.]
MRRFYVVIYFFFFLGLFCWVEWGEKDDLERSLLPYSFCIRSVRPMRRSDCSILRRSSGLYQKKTDSPLPTFRSDYNSRLALALCTAGIVAFGIYSCVYEWIAANA